MQTLLHILKSAYASTSSLVVSGAPKIAVAILVIVLGLLVARVVRAGLHYALGFVKFDALADRVGLSDVLARAEVKSSAREILGTIVYWTLLLFTGVVALGVLGLATSATFAAVGEIIPNVVIAAAILILGFNVASFLSKLIQTAVVNAEIRKARFIRNAAHYGMSTLVAILAAKQLGISDAILTTSFFIFFGGTCLAMALAFGLGSREWVGRMAESSWKQEQEQSRTLSNASALGVQVFPSSNGRSRRTSKSSKLAA
jgi:mechanosensitive ion channel-like protein